MPINKKEQLLEETRLKETLTIIRKKISNLGAELYDDQEKVLEFKKFLWDSHTEMDPSEMKVMMSDNDIEVSIMMKRGAYLQKLYRIQNKPYFGSILFETKEDGLQSIYIGINHVEEDLNYYVHDWRSPICSLFYDYELGRAQYEAPAGMITGTIQRKRQYTIENQKLLHIFDNEINIDDELLQEVLSTESSDKMKNIVNTIQKEQNQVIRNINDKNLIVQGIAGSGKTSVALHRIAFLLYKIEALNSKNILIFSPNQVFSQYISNVLPELGEENTKETSIHDFFLSYLPEFKQIETVSDFIEAYYQHKNSHIELTIYKLSDNITEDMNAYLENFINTCQFTDDIITRDITITKEELNHLLKIRYQHFPLFKRLEVIAEKLCDWNYAGKYHKKKSVLKLLYDKLNCKKDYITIYNQFFKSSYSNITREENQIKNKSFISYEDATLFIILKNYLEGINYNTDILHIVIDEAQDYTKTQYLLLFSIFRKGEFTILGDVNQTINPYYQYESLNTIKDLLPNSKYLELLKTYRSSEEIIHYTNKILGLHHIQAIRRGAPKEVIQRNHSNHLKQDLISDIQKLKQEYQSLAIITKTEEETNDLYDQLNQEISIVKMDQHTQEYRRDFIILPSYLAKGLEFDAVIIYTDPKNPYTKTEKNLFYVACTRAQHQLIVYNQNT